MNLRNRIPTKPLDELRLARIERNILADYQRLPRETELSPKHWVVPALAAVAATCLAVVGLKSLGVIDGEKAQPTPVAINPAAQPIELSSGDRELAFDLGRATVRLAPESRVVIHETTDSGSRMVIQTGRVDCEVEPYEGRPAFLVQADDVLVTVVGTVFAVDKRGGVRVEVTRGKVQVERGAEQSVVAAGESWGRATNVAIAKALPAAGATLSAVEGRTDQATGALPEERTAKRPTGRKADSRRTASLPRKQDEREPEVDDTVVSYGRPVRGLDSPLDVGTASPKRAVRIYRRMSVGRGDEAARALYSLAHVQLYKLRNASGAAASAKRYESRFRRGPNAESLLWLRIAALCDSGQRSACRAAAHSYIRRYPGGRFATSVGRVLNQLGR